MAIIDRVKFDGTGSGDWLVCKHNSEELSTATKLIVGEGQVALFVKGGRICDEFYPGTYTLSTDNIPILNTIIKMPYGGKAPFTAEVYFINTTSKLEMYWGTKDAMPIVDPKYGVRLRIRAFGQFGIKLSDYGTFLRELIGTLGPYKICNKNQIQEFFKGHLITKLKTIIASEIIKNNISALDIAAHLEDLSKAAEERIEAEFKKFGISIVNFFIESINFPDEDFDMINKILVDKAAFDIIGENRYHTMRSFDVYEKAAENDGGIGASMAGMGIGVGLAANMANTAANITKEPRFDRIQAVENVDEGWECSECGKRNVEAAKFCSSCGERRIKGIVCEECGTMNEKNAKFCCECGNNLVKEKKCPGCGITLSEGVKFCGNCGERIGV